MIETSIFWLRAATVLYALGLLHSILSVLRHKQSVFAVALGAFRIAVVLHGVALVDLAMAYGHLPVANFYQALSLCAFLIALVFLAVQWRYKFSSTSVVLFPLIFVMTLVSAMERPVATWPDPRVRDTWLIVHIFLVLAGYAALLLTAVAAVAYLIQERRLKSKQTSTFLERLPPLATLDNLISKSLGLGFAFITLGVVFGLMWAFIESGTRWIGEARVTLSLFTWVLLLVMMFLRSSAGWRGRKAAVMAIAVLGCSALTWVAHTGLGTLLTR
jgi:ABC-type uncharacterized transport system permease subunit